MKRELVIFACWLIVVTVIWTLIVVAPAIARAAFVPLAIATALMYGCDALCRWLTWRAK